MLPFLPAQLPLHQDELLLFTGDGDSQIGVHAESACFSLAVAI
jgi:hypothetical protein